MQAPALPAKSKLTVPSTSVYSRAISLRSEKGENMPRTLLAASLLTSLCAFAMAQTPPTHTIATVFGQAVSYTLPGNFVSAYEDRQGGRYIHEAVPDGENVNQWTQMITLTGAQGLAADPDITPIKFAGSMAAGFKRVCPTSFFATGLGSLKVDEHDAFAAFVSCGTAPAGDAAHSESMLVIVIKGTQDYYTVQWAERSTASPTPLAFDRAKWAARLRQLAPIRLCPIGQDASAPSPSCINRP
jgi:hypothetical protein